jgi:CRISPR/Cas system-associated endoribonuclease Cas2
LVKYSRIIHKGPLSKDDKKKLKQEINAIIDAATRSITIEAIVQPPKGDQEESGGY